jgi:hypothetical protein
MLALQVLDYDPEHLRHWIIHCVARNEFVGIVSMGQVELVLWES